MREIWQSWGRWTGVEPWLIEVALAALGRTARPREALAGRVTYNQLKVLEAFRAHQVDEGDLAPSSGYAYNDRGRQKLESLYAQVFGAEAALVRPQIVSGTHALAIALFGILRPGDELVLATGTPYDTLLGMIGLRPGEPGALTELGVKPAVVPLLPGGSPDLEALVGAITPRTRMVFIQRSRGYALRPSIPVDGIAEIVAAVKRANPEAVCLVDNCYGELVEEREPAQVGADLIAGSLIKNPGGGLASTGGYLAGRAELVNVASGRLTAPGIGGEVGPFPGSTKREFFQGLYQAPQAVGQALEGAVFASDFFGLLGFETDPQPPEPRTDLIQSVVLGSRERLIAFCQGLQSGSPVDSHVRPVPWPMPGYDHDVIMAAGAFTQGSSIELSSDGPLREPYVAYLQGGLNRDQVVAACLLAAQAMDRAGLLPEM